jgi:hypothetical protein
VDVQASMKSAYHGGRALPRRSRISTGYPPGLPGERERATSPPPLHSTGRSNPRPYFYCCRRVVFARLPFPRPRARDNILPAASSAGTQAASPHLPTARGRDADRIAIVGVRPTSATRQSHAAGTPSPLLPLQLAIHSPNRLLPSAAAAQQVSRRVVVATAAAPSPAAGR